MFPLFLSLLSPDAPQLGRVLDLLRDPEHLWSSYGIRSLSAAHPEFGQGENYWKGPIWVQMNYLILRALHTVRFSQLLHVFTCLIPFQTYAAQSGPYQARAKEIYSELRKNLVDNVFKVTSNQCQCITLAENLERSMNGRATFGNNMMLLPGKAKEGR